MSTFEELNQNQIPKKPTFSKKIRDFWLKHGEKIILVVGIILIALVSFEAGFLKGQKNQKNPVIVNQPACAPCPEISDNKTVNKTSNAVQQNDQNNTGTQPNTENQKCAFAASKNSNKYHLSTCQWATKIKPENKICFSSTEEAESRGYQAAKCCIK